MTSTLAEQRETWPNSFIVGAKKAGTSSLYFYLSKIPAVYMSPMKEPFYFAPNHVKRDPRRMIMDRKKYLGLFKKAAGYLAVGEASPAYLWDPDSPTLIHQMIPQARIIIILRDPIERAYSDYLYDLKFHSSGIQSSFYDEVTRNHLEFNSASKLYVEYGFYYEQVKRFLDIFGQEQVKIIIFEEFVQNLVQTVNDVLSFLGLNDRVTTINEQYNKYSVSRTALSPYIFHFFRWVRARGIKTSTLTSVLPHSAMFLIDDFLFKAARKPEIEPKAVKFLQQIYRGDVAKLENLIGRSLPWNTVLKK